jgi:peptide chain release factor subunit 1
MGVLDSLQKVLSTLRQYRFTPSNGLAVYASPESVRVVEPSEPFLREVYFCGPKFMLDPLREQLEDKAQYALIVLDRKEVTLGLLRGSRVIELDSKESHVPPKHDAGGQSQHRWERQTEQAAHEFFVKIGDMANRSFLDQVDRLDGVLIGGPGDTKRQWAEGEFMDYRLVRKVLRPLVDVSYTNEFGLQELVRSAGDLLAHLSLQKDQIVVTKFADAVRQGLAEYGHAEVLRALEERRASALVLYEGVDSRFHDVVDVAVGQGVPVHLLAEEGASGAEFLKGFGGLGVILRYRPTA